MHIAWILHICVQPNYLAKATAWRHYVNKCCGCVGVESRWSRVTPREARKAIATRQRTPEQVGGQVLVARTPPMAAAGESQGGTSITLAIRTLEATRRVPPPRRAPAWRLFLAEEELAEDSSAPPASTTPPKLAGDGEGLKRKRPHTAKYAKSVAHGDIKESQHGKRSRQ
jgi:hypothetical protein